MKSKWNLDILTKEALKYKTRSEFEKNNKAAYIAAGRLGCRDIICSHMPKHVDQSGENNPRFKWTKEKILKEAKKYKNKSDFIKNSHGAYKASKRLGILSTACLHMKVNNNNGHNNPNYKWTKNYIKNISLKFKSKIDFKKSCPAVYEAAYRRGILDQITNHMVKNIKWNKNSLKKIALKYNKRVDFEKECPAANSAARRMGVIDDICSHMEKSNSISYDEKNIFNIVQSKYFSAQTLRKRNIKIKKYPKLKGFDIDIFIPELNKGIEFDGDYWHGKGFNRIWTKDPEEYHRVKDEYFKSIGIEILHIKESDWKNNKALCLNKIWKFLK